MMGNAEILVGDLVHREDDIVVVKVGWMLNIVNEFILEK